MTELNLGLATGYWGATPPSNLVELAQEAEKLGFDSVWTSESYGNDAFTPLCWMGAHTKKIKLGTAIVQMSARTPAACAMHALALDHLSNGRLILGLGVSGPQVVEGWYGQPFPKPLARTREYIGIIKQVLARKEPVTNAGPHYPLPYDGDNGMGIGKPLKSIVHPLRENIPIYMGAEGPKNVALAAEIAEGWLPLFYNPYDESVYAESLKHAPADFKIAQMVPVIFSDDIDAALHGVKSFIALYVGGMGAKGDSGMNFHKDLFVRMGYEAEANKIQELYLDGRKAEAAAVVPDELADAIALVGPKDRIKDRLQAWKASRVTTLLIGSQDVNTLRTVAELI